MCVCVYVCVCVCVCVCDMIERLRIKMDEDNRELILVCCVFAHEYRVTLKSESHSECVNTLCSSYDVKFCIKRRKKTLN